MGEAGEVRGGQAGRRGGPGPPETRHGTAISPQPTCGRLSLVTRPSLTPRLASGPEGAPVSSRPNPAPQNHHQALPPVPLKLSNQAGPDPMSILARIFPAAARSLRTECPHSPTPVTAAGGGGPDPPLGLLPGPALGLKHTWPTQLILLPDLRAPSAPRGAGTSESSAYPVPHPSTRQSPFCLQVAGQRVLGPHLLEGP